MSLDLNTAVTVTKRDNVYAHVDTEDFDFLIDLRDYFSFFADGYKFHPAYKRKQWDGRTHLLNVNGLLPIGLVSELVRFCERHNKQCFVDPSIRTFNVSEEKFTKFVHDLNIHSGYVKIDPYDYQIRAAYSALTNGRRLLLSPTSSGKSLIAYILTRMYQKMSNDKILIVVPNVGLVTQMSGDFTDYSSEVDWCAKDNITTVSSGEIQEPDKQIVICTYQALTNAKTKPPPEFFHQFKYIIVDEVHTATSKSVKYIMNASTEAEFRVGLTGTLDESKTHEMVLRGMFGDVERVIDTHELMGQGKVANLKIYCGLIKYPDDVCKHMRASDRGKVHLRGKKKDTPVKTKAEYPEEISYIINSQERNRFGMRFAAGLEGNTIIMIHQVQHGRNLYKWMSESLPNRNIYLYTGSTDKDEREEIRTLMEKNDGCIIIGSLGVLSTGISIKRLHNMLLFHPSKSKIKVLQSVGRLLRKSNFGNLVKLYDFVDDFSIGSYENYLLSHGRDRVRYYYDQKFDVSTNIIKLEDVS